jgi:hypothetical protein
MKEDTHSCDGRQPIDHFSPTSASLNLGQIHGSYLALLDLMVLTFLGKMPGRSPGKFGLVFVQGRSSLFLSAQNYTGLHTQGSQC